ncbi:MAG: nucleotidyltransferase domain-containing protein [Planctomycetota bacterium]
MDRDTLLRELASYFASHSEVVAAYLFGSVARGDHGTASDVDVGVVLAAGAPRDLAGIEAIGDLHADLEDLLRREVDCVVLNDASPDLLHRVLRDGLLVHESDHRRRILFEVKARNDYFDMQPAVSLYRRTVLGSL